MCFHIFTCRHNGLFRIGASARELPEFDMVAPHLHRRVLYSFPQHRPPLAHVKQLASFVLLRVDRSYSGGGFPISRRSHVSDAPEKSTASVPTLLKCGHCGADNTVATCPTCARAFVVVASHLRGEVRQFQDAPVLSSATLPPQIECDFCVEKRIQRLAKAVSAGLQQRTCVSCHTEFLSQHKL